jgi:hypothetical protein
MKNIKCAILLLAIAGILAAIVYSRRNPLERYGVYYQRSHGEHYEITILDFWLRTDHGKVIGPSFIGDNLSVDFPFVAGDPVPEIVVRSGSDLRDVVRLTMRDGKAVGFHIVDGNQIGVTYSPEGYHCP